MKFKNTVIIFAATAITLSVYGQQTEKITFSEGVFDDNTSWSVCVADAVTGEIITDKDAGLNLVPASVMKLIPSAAALTLLGDDYRFTTTLAFSGSLDKKKGALNGNIYIIGGGDPMFCSPYFADSYGDVTGNWVNILKEAGIKKISGDIISDASIYDYQPVDGGWEWEDIGNYYGAGVHGINYNDNVFGIYLSGNKEGYTPVIDSTDTFSNNLKIINHLTSYGASNKGFAYSAPYSAEVLLEGSVPAESIAGIFASIPDPPLTVAVELRKRLIKEGIFVTGEAFTKRTKETNDSIMEVLSAVVSPSLKEMISVTDHESVNLYAAQLSKHLGLMFRQEGSFRAGMDVLSSFLETIGCNTQGILLSDAAGLSRKNYINTGTIVSLLKYMYNSPYKTTFISSLPTPGENGTLKNTFSEEVFKGRIIAKTGSMTGVKGIAGYVTTKSGRVLAFSILVNGYTIPGKEIQYKMEEILKEIILNY